MKQIPRKNMTMKLTKAIAGMSAIAALCGVTAFADPLNTPFLLVDVDGGTSPVTQAGFQSFPIPAQGSWNLGLSWSQTFSAPANFTSNAYTPGPISVTITATNSEAAAATNANWYTNFPSYLLQNVPGGYNVGSAFPTGASNQDLLNDFVAVDHYPPVGFGLDYIQVTVSGLKTNENYEFTAWDYDAQWTTSGYQINQVGWTFVDPNAYTTNNSFQPPNSPYPNARVIIDGGPQPTTAYGNSGSFTVHTDTNGSFTVYAYEDDQNYNGAFQEVPFNGFALGPGIDTNYLPNTNIITTLNNPAPITVGPPAGWQYYNGLNINDSGYTNNTFPTTVAGTSPTTLGETFIPTRDMVLRNFYFVCRSTTNTGHYTPVLWDLGVTNLANTSQFYATNTPTANPPNLLDHPAQFPLAYWDFAPGGTNVLTNMTVVRFQLPSPLDQVTLTQGHSYFLGFTWVAGSGSNDLVLAGTTNGLTYTNGAAFGGKPAFAGAEQNMQTTGNNLIMALDVLNPNPAVSLSSYPLTAATTSWPNLAGMGNGGNPLYTVAMGTPTYDTAQGGDPGYLDFIATGDGSGNAPNIGYIDAGAAQSMSVYVTNSFKLGAIGIVMRGVGSSNALMSLSVYRVTNTFFSSTTTIEKFPRNYQPNIDTEPLGLPVWQTNVNFYYTTNDDLSGTGTTNQILILTLPSQYQANLVGNNSIPTQTPGSGYGCYVFEISAPRIGQNASSPNLFLWEHNSLDSGWQDALFPASVTGSILGDGYDTNGPSAGTYYLVEPVALGRASTDPDVYAGMIAGTGSPRQYQLALYQASGVQNPTNIVINTVSHSNSGSSTVLNWTATGGSGAYTFSVWGTSSLNPPITWTQLASGLPATPTTYTDTSATGAVKFYRVTSP